MVKPAGSWTGELVQVVNKDLSSVPQNSREESRVLVIPVQGTVSEADWPPRLALLSKFQASEKPCLKRKKKEKIEGLKAFLESEMTPKAVHQLLHAYTCV